MTTVTSQSAPVHAARAVRAAGALLTAITWASAGIFGAYILAFYGGAVQDGALDKWNTVLPRLYEASSPIAAIAIGLHFATGGILLLLGPIQLVGAVRARAPALHRWLGRVYATCALVAGLGGLFYIALKGTVGGLPMNIGFGMYGALMALAAVQTARHAMARRLDMHRAWAIRLFALAIGSWLYRMDYGFWSLLTDGAGHTKTFDGWFDVFMAFFFYIPNLIVAELFIRARRRDASPVLQTIAATTLLAAAGFIALATYYFTLYSWGPAILARF